MRRRIAFNAQANWKKSDARTRAHSESFAKQLIPSAQARHEFTQPIMRQRFDVMIIAAGH